MKWRNKMNITRITYSEMEIGKKYTTILLLLSVYEKNTKNGDPYIDFLFSDGEKSFSAKMFQPSLKGNSVSTTSSNLLVAVTLRVENYRGVKSFLVEDISPSDDGNYCIDDFIQKAPINIEMEYSELKNILSKFPDGNEYNQSISKLTKDILDFYKDKFLRSSAAKMIHHNYIGGLLQHTVTMVKSSIKICEIYDSLDKELLICGAALHDIGKIFELETSITGAAEYTSKGRLLGHSALGVMMVAYVSKAGSYDGERVLLLEHMIASHHGHTEYGAIVEPAIPEAVVLHAIDMIDSRSFVFDDAYKNVDPGMISGKIFGLNNNTVYKALKSSNSPLLLPNNRNEK